MQDGVGGLRGGYEYSRSANPTRTALEGAIAALEEGERGFAFASGLAAEDTVIRSLCKPGDHWSSRTTRTAARSGCSTRSPGLGVEHSPRRCRRRRRARRHPPGQTRMVWVETPTNPLLNIGDIEALAGVAHEAGALLVVDNTFASPYLQQPLPSARTWCCTPPRSTAAATPTSSAGQSSSASSSSPTGSPSTRTRWARSQDPSTRSLPTAGSRRWRSHGPALRQRRGIVEFLAGHPSVAQVIYPGLEEHPATPGR